MPALAQPQIPATVYGSVTVDGAPAPTGTEVRAFIGDTDCTQAAPGERLAFRHGEATAYVVTVLHETQRPGCGRGGVTITFLVDGRPALQSLPWKPGPTELNLSVGSPAVIPLPTSTPTPPGGATQPPRPTPAGPPPVDDATVPGALQPAPPPAGAAGPVPSPAEGEDGGLTPWLVTLALAIMAAAGGVAAYITLRRRRPT
jgi:hypothetical protein